LDIGNITQRQLYVDELPRIISGPGTAAGRKQESQPEHDQNYLMKHKESPLTIFLQAEQVTLEA
jgi:hypothetical protein